MRRFAAWGFCLVVMVSASGCLCRCATDHYADVIDDISDHNLEVDCLYCPAYDLTRIGYPDWCECPVNRALDPYKCACNLPYYGPRNRTLYAITDIPSGLNRGTQNQPVSNETSLPPSPDGPDALDLPPAPASEPELEKPGM